MKTLLTILTATFFLFACQSAPPVKQSLTAAPASAQVKTATDHLADAGKMVATTQKDLEDTLKLCGLDFTPANFDWRAWQAQVRPIIMQANQHNQAAAAAVATAHTELVSAVPAVVAQERAGADCEAQLPATKDYGWLRILIIGAGTIAAAALGVCTLACMFASVASAAWVSKIPIISGLVSGARSALLLAMAELAGAVAVCALLAAHLAAAVNWGVAIVACTGVYLGLRAIGWRRIKAGAVWALDGVVGMIHGKKTA